MAATSSGDPKNTPFPIAISLDKPTMEEVLERLLDSKFSRIEARLAALERQNEALIKASDEEENQSNQVLKVMNTRFSEMSSQLAAKGHGATTNPLASLTPVPACGANFDANITTRLEGLEKGLKAIHEDKRALEMMTQLDKKVTAMSSKLTFMDTKVNKIALIETKVSKLSSIDDKMTQMNTFLHQMTSLPLPVNTSYPPPPIPLPMNNLNARNSDETLKQLIESKFKELPAILGTTELQAMAPKVQQLQSNLEVLLTGESEANALIDKLLPTVSDLQSDFEALKTNQDEQFKTITEDLFPKMATAVSDCYAKLQSVYDKASDAKGYAKDAADLAEDANEKLNKVQKTLLSSGVSVVSSTSDHHHQRKRKTSLTGLSIPVPGADPSRSRSQSVDGEDRVPTEQLARLHASIELLKKEIRKVDVMDLVEERLIPNVYTIRKNIDLLMQKNHLEVGGGGGYGGSGSGSSAPMGSRERGSRPQYRSSHDLPVMGGPRGVGYRGRGGPGFRRSTTRRFIPGTKWTYDERGVREQDSDEEIEFRGSPKSRSRSRSRSPAAISNARSRKHHSEDEDSDDAEIAGMEKQIGKIWGAVEGIQTKMDSWLKQTKKSSVKGDENMEITLKKLSSISGAIEALRDTTEDEFRNVVEKVSAEEIVMADRVDPDEIRSLFKNLELKVDARFNEYLSTFDQNRAQIKEVLQEVKKVDVVIERTKALKKTTTDYSQTGLQMAALLKKIELNTAKLPMADSSSLDSSLVSQLKEIQPKLDYLYVKIMPTLEDMKKIIRKNSQNAPSQMSDLEELAKLEQRQLLQKIAEGIQEVKEIHKASKKNDQVGLAPIHENSIMQLYNAINELKNKENNHFKMTSEIKSETLKMSKLLADPTRIKNQEKQLSKTFFGVEELKKSSASDGKTLSQMNTVLQGLKASTSAQEAKVSNLLREIKDQIHAIRTDVQESITDFKSEQFGANDELKNLVQMVEQPKDQSAIENARKQEMEHLLKEFHDTVEKIQSVAKNDSDLIDESIKKTLQIGLADIEDSLKEFQDVMKANYEEHCAEIQGHCQGVEIKLSTLNSVPSSSGGIASSDSQGGTSKATAANTSKAVKSAQFEYNSLLEELNDKVDDLGKDSLKGFQKLADEMNKFKGISSEILNSVEDMRLLSSSTPNALHDLVPKIDQIAKEVHEIPNATLGNNACLEENLCANLDKVIKEEHEKTMSKISDKFETMDHRLAVIRKYAKHGPSAAGGLTNSQESPSPHVAPSGPLEPQHSTSGLDRVMNHITQECQRLAGNPNQTDVTANLNQTMERLIPMVEDIHAMDKQLIQDMAREAVIEDQMQVVADTILQEFNKMPPVLDKMVVLLENDFHSLVEQSLVQASTSGGKGGGQGNPNAGALLSIIKTEEKLLAKQNECMVLLTEMQKANARYDENLRDIGEVKAAVYNLSQDLSPAKTNEAVKKLVEYLKRVQNAQSQILERADRSIHFQTTLNDIFKKLVPTLEVIQNCLDEREGQNLDSGDLSKLCADLQEKISALDELESELSAPKTQTCEDLRELVQMIVKVLDRLLKDKDLVMTEEEPMVLVQESQMSPSPPLSASKSTKSQSRLGSKKRKGRLPKELPAKSRPGSVSFSAKRKRTSASSRLASPKLAPKRGGVRTPRLNYSEEVEEEDEEVSMLVQSSTLHADSSMVSDSAEASHPATSMLNVSITDDAKLGPRRRPSISINMSPSTSSSVVTPPMNKAKPRKRKSKAEAEAGNQGNLLKMAEVRLRKSDVDIALADNHCLEVGAVLPPKRRPMPKSKALAASSVTPSPSGVASESESLGVNTVPSDNIANADPAHKPSTVTRQSLS